MSENLILAAIRELAPALRERAAETEELCRVPDISIKEIRETGFFRLMQPPAHGGCAAAPVVFYEAVKEIAAACGSTGWVASVLGAHTWHLALFDPEAQEEVWGIDPTALIASSYAPTGRIVPSTGGFRVSGRWRFSSGCDHADWALLGGLALDGNGVLSDTRTFLVPKSAYTIDPVWDAVGLCGTGSHDILVEDAYVPEHRTLGASAHPGRELNPEPLYRLPHATVISTSVSASIVGIAESAYASSTAGSLRSLEVGGSPAECCM